MTARPALLAVILGLVVAAIAPSLPAAATPSGVFSDDDGLPSERYLERLHELGVVRGCGEGISCPSQTLSRAEAAAMVVRMTEMSDPQEPDEVPTEAGQASIGLTFVDDDAVWNGEAERHIESLVSRGIVNGCDATARLFCPLRAISRGEAIAILSRAFSLSAGNLSAGATAPFVDVEGLYYEDAVRAGAAAGFLDVSAPLFRGEHSITRGEFAMWLSEAAGLNVCRPNPFTEGRQAALTAQFPGRRFTGFAWDAETGCTYSFNTGNRQPTASVFKVMVMAGTLLEAQSANRSVTTQELAWLRPMISVSANDPVRALWSHFGGAPWFNKQADLFGLDETTIVGDYDTVWGRTATSARDQVDLLRQILFREFGPFNDASQNLAWELMTNMDPAQRWGVGTFAPDGALVAQKNGFAGVTASSVGAVVLPSGRGYALAVLSTGWSDWTRGVGAVDTIANWVHESLANESLNRDPALLESRPVRESALSLHSPTPV